MNKRKFDQMNDQSTFIKHIKEEIDSIKFSINTSGYVNVRNLPILLHDFNRMKYIFNEDIILYSLKGIEVSDHPSKYVNIVRCLLHNDVSFNDQTYSEIYGSYRYYSSFRSVFKNDTSTQLLSNYFLKMVEMMNIIRNNNINIEYLKINKNLCEIIKNYYKTEIYDSNPWYYSWGQKCYKVDDYS